MQVIPEELTRVLSQRMKLGEYAKPVCRVEVDRMSFVPGRTEDISFAVNEEKEKIVVEKVRIEGDGETITNPLAFRFPVEGKGTGDITSKFGMRMHPTLKVKKMHEGIDIGAPTGTKIVACWGGTVSYVNEDKSQALGLYVVVTHPNGFKTYYGHMSKILVGAGEKVDQGTYLGEVGTTGRSTGPHLHFGLKDPATGKFIDSYPYMIGNKKLHTESTTTGPGVISEGQMQGSIGDYLFFQEFNHKDWVDYENILDYDTGLLLGAIKWDKNNKTTCTINNYPNGTPEAKTLGFSFKINTRQAGYFDMNFAGTKELGELRIFNGIDLLARVTKFEGADSFQNLKFAFGAGVGGIRVEVKFNGSAKHSFVFNYVKVSEFIEGDENGSGAPAQYAEKASAVVFNETTTSTAKIEVGSFVYRDTITLDSVTSIDMDDQFEMDSREARIVISNPDGYYSPDYNPFYFPETYMDTPWSYPMNGLRYGVLSENTEIRIYLGYGLNVLRVFTGLIDKIDMQTENPSITIYVRDMYKKILTKVISEDKKYGDVALDPVVGTPISDTGDASGLNYRQQIISKAKYYAQQRNPKMDYMFLLAIATQETGMGTTGYGPENKGGWILSYDAHEGGFRPQYKGVDKQLYYGALRYHEAMKSRNWEITTLDDVIYFDKGGDKGAYDWAEDPNWPTKVFQIYTSMKLDPPADFASTPIWKATTTAAPDTSVTSKGIGQGSAWLKSSIINDLVVHAGLSGWRQAPADQSYPDYIIEESYLIERDANNRKVIKAVPDKEGEFTEEPWESILTPQGWLNPFVDLSREWKAYEHMVYECINEVIKDTNYRVHCDRYGTFRMEQIDLHKPIAATFSEYDNLVSLTKTLDYSRARSHIVVKDDKGKYEHFVDAELLMELKGEVRTVLLDVPYAKTKEAKKQIADRMFWDIKRICRTLQVSIPGNPALDVLDRVYVSDQRTTTRSLYLIKGIKSSFSVENGYMQIIDLTWAGEGASL